MGLNKLNSKQLMDILANAQAKISALEANMATLKLNLDDRLSVIRNIQEYEQTQMTQLTMLAANGKLEEQAEALVELTRNTAQTNEVRALAKTIKEGTLDKQIDKVVFSRANIVAGLYSMYGSVLMPRIIGTLTDVFNFKTTTGYTYKDNGIFMINDITKPKYLGALYNDTISGQPICFEEFENSVLNITIRVNPGELLGSTAFNMIEILPFMPGSFTINNIKVFSMQGYYLGQTLPDTMIEGPIDKAGAMRIMLDDMYNLYELQMQVVVNKANSNGKYPFGLKHIYFLNGSLDPDSYVVVKVDQPGYINSISEDLTVVDQTGVVSTSCNEEGIKLYVEYIDGVGSDQISTSKGLTENLIPRDIKSFYMYCPIFRSTISLQFDNIALR